MPNTDIVQPFWKRKKLWASLGLFALSLLALLRAPFWLASYVHDKYPYLSIRGEDVRLSLSRVEFRNVTLDKAWMRGTLAKVTVDVNKNVRIQGGRLEVNAELRPDGEGKGDSSVHFQEVTLDAVSVLYKEVRLDTKGFFLRPQAYCFDNGRGHLPHELALVQKFEFKDLCVMKDLSSVTAKEVVTEVTPPKPIPKVEGPQPVLFTDLKINLREKFLQASRLLIGGVPFLEGYDVVLGQLDGVYNVDVRHLNVLHPWLSPDIKTFHNVGASYNSEGELSVSWGPKAGLSVIRFDKSLHQVTGENSCDGWVHALPEPASPVFAGRAPYYKGHLSFDVRALPTPHVSIKNQCAYDCNASPIKELRRKFTYEAYKADGETNFTRTSGPGTSDWVPLSELPVNVGSAFIQLEDPSFLSHRGILTASLKVALEQNIEKGFFFRGGSTITQQLAKNLWLKRHKTVGRKVEEAFLTIALESCLSKQEILETYLNVVEMGPDIYGIGPATRYYFHKAPSELNMAEAYYLASLLPNPKEATPPYRGGIEKARRLMAKLASVGYISEDLIPPEEEVVSVNQWIE